MIIDNIAGAGGQHRPPVRGPSLPCRRQRAAVWLLWVRSIALHLMKLGYDPVKDLAPITMGVNFLNVLVVNAGRGIKTFADFIAYAKKNPGKLEYASTGAGSASHLAGELMDDVQDRHRAHSLQGRCAGAAGPVGRPGRHVLLDLQHLAGLTSTTAS